MQGRNVIRFSAAPPVSWTTQHFLKFALFLTYFAWSVYELTLDEEFIHSLSDSVTKSESNVYVISSLHTFLLRHLAAAAIIAVLASADC